MSENFKGGPLFFDVLRKGSYNKTISLIPKGHIYFHWGDFDLTCRYQQMLLTHDPFAIQKWNSLDMAMQFLKSFLIWIKNDKEIIESNLYDIYVCDLFDKKKMNLLLNEKSLVSCTGYRGEFVPFDRTSWHNPLLHQQFIYEKILSDEVKLRKFRLKLQAPIYLKLPKQGQEMLANCEQITSRGLLFTLQDKESIEKIMKEDKILVYLNLLPIKELSELTLLEMHEKEFQQNPDKLGPLFSQQKNDVFHVIVKDINFSHNILFQSTHMLIPYEALVSEFQKEKLEVLIPSFLRKVESEIREQVEKRGNLYIFKKAS